METALVGGLAAAASKLITFVAETSESPTDDANLATLFGLGPEVRVMAERTSGYIQPCTVPLITTSIVFLVAWGSLKSADATKEAKARARRAYLYADGAFGFVSQMFLAAGIGILLGAGASAEELE